MRQKLYNYSIFKNCVEEKFFFVTGANICTRREVEWSRASGIFHSWFLDFYVNLCELKLPCDTVITATKARTVTEIGEGGNVSPDGTTAINITVDKYKEYMFLTLVNMV